MTPKKFDLVFTGPSVATHYVRAVTRTEDDSVVSVAVRGEKKRARVYTMLEFRRAYRWNRNSGLVGGWLLKSLTLSPDVTKVSTTNAEAS